MKCQYIGVELQKRVTHFACGLSEKLQPSFEQLGIEPGERDMLGHGHAPESARPAQLH
jgi:hypothetical protein